jgi:hypothetical protein
VLEWLDYSTNWHAHVKDIVSNWARIKWVVDDGRWVMGDGKWRIGGSGLGRSANGVCKVPFPE